MSNPYPIRNINLTPPHNQSYNLLIFLKTIFLIIQMAISALYIVSINGNILISRDYRHEVDLETIEQFILLLNSNVEDEATSSPILYFKNYSFVHLKTNNLYLISVTKRNTNIVTVVLFMHRFLEILYQYFNILEEESIKDNFIIIHELLDEIIDYGYPQITDAKVLQTYITQQSFKLNKLKLLPSVVTNVVSWRPEGIFYRHNEVFVDVIESVHLSIGSKGGIMKQEVVGVIKMKVHLSGMPQLRLGFGGRLFVMLENHDGASPLEGIRFHQCVQLSRIGERSIYFVPPDGDFELMSYRFHLDSRPPIQVHGNIRYNSNTRIEYEVSAVSQFKSATNANNVEILVPVSQYVDSPIIKASTGHAKYYPEKGAILWRIRYFPGGIDYLLNATFRLPSVKAEEKDTKIPIQVKFTVPYLAVSGLQIKFLKVIEKMNYKALTWVRYTTQNGDYFINF